MRWSLILIPIALAVAVLAPERTTLVFACSVAALIPLAAMMGESTEQLAAHVGPSVGGFLNATFGNLSELIVMIALLQRGLHEVVMAGIFGGIVTNALFAAGLAMLLGGMKHHVQAYNRENTRDLATMLTIAIFGMLVISVIGYSLGAGEQQHGDASLEVSIFLLVGYALFLVYSMGTHRDLFRSAESEEPPAWSLWKAIAVLGVVTALVVWISENLSATIEAAVAETGVNQLFVGAVLIALIGAAAEIASAIRAARKDRMDLALSIAMGGSVQIALLVAPLMVLLSFLIGPHPLRLVFSYESVMVLFFSVMITMQLARDGRSTWFKGALLVIVYLIIAGGILMMPE